MTNIRSAPQSNREIDAARLSAPQASALCAVRQQTQHLNEAIEAAVRAGMTIEVTRTHRCYSGGNLWGDQIVAVIEAASIEPHQ